MLKGMGTDLPSPTASSAKDPDMMTPKWLPILIALFATAACTAQQKFPERPGEWTFTTQDPTSATGAPMTLLFCLNDELWTKALVGNPACTISQMTIHGSGGSYSFDCPTKSFENKGNAKLTFDGATHIVSKAGIDTSMNGKTTHMESNSDFRWKGPACNPSVDLNLKSHSAPSH